MTVKRAKFIFAHHKYAEQFPREKEGFSLSYFSAAMIALALASLIALIGYVTISDSADGYLFDSTPMVIVVPSAG